MENLFNISTARRCAQAMQCKILKFNRDKTVDGGCPCKHVNSCRLLIENKNMECEIKVNLQTQKELML